MSEALQVVRGDPTPEQLAALVVVIAARADDGPPADRRPRRWAHPARTLRGPLRPGPDAWSSTR